MNNIVKRPAPALALGDTLLKMLVDPNISAEKTQILLQTQKDIMAESRREAFQTAFAALAAELPQVDKRGIVELVKEGRVLGRYNFAKWEDMDAVIRPIMFRHGFSFSFASRVDSGKQILVGKLMHSAGHFEISERLLIADPGPGRNTLQAEGSGLSYAKRYVAEGLLNIVRKGQDDDGIASGLKLIDAAQVKQLAGLLGETGTKTEMFLGMFVTGATSLEEIAARDLPRLLNALQEKKRSLAAKKSQKNEGS
jgi:hypothetical protein